MPDMPVNLKQLKQQAKQLQAQLNQASPTETQHYELGIALFDLGEWDKAIAQFQAACALEPNHLLAHYHWGIALLLQDKLPEAKAQFQTAVDCDCSGDEAVDRSLPKLGLAAASICTGKKEEAIAQLEAAIEDHPDLLTSQLRFLLSLYGESRRARFAQASQAALEQEPSAENCYRFALARFAQKEHRDAIRWAEQGIADYPEMPQFHLVKAYGESGLGQDDEAITTLEKGRAQHPESAVILNNLVALYQIKKQRNRKQLLELYEQVIALEPTLAYGHYNLGFLSSLLRYKQRAMHHLRALRFNPLLPQIYNALSEDYSQDRTVKQSIQAAQWNLKFAEVTGEPVALKAAKVQLGVAKYQRRTRYLFAGIVGSLVVVLGLSLQGLSVPTIFHACRLLFHLSGDYVDTPREEAFLKKSLERYPNQPLYQALQGDTWLLQDRPQEAKQAYQRAVELTPNEAYYKLLLAQAEVSLKNYDSAISQLQQAVTLNGSELEYPSELVRVLTLKGNATEAAELFDQTLSQQPERSETYLDYGEALWEVGDYDAAIAQLEKTIELAPQRTRPYYYLGLSLGAQQQWQAAADAFKTALDIDEDLYLTQQEMGKALLKLGQVEEAIPHFRKSLALYPESEHYQLALANALVRRGGDEDLEEAIAIFRQSIRDYQEWPDPHEGLGHALRQQGDAVAALASYKMAQQLYRNNGEDKEAEAVQSAIEQLP